MSLYLKDALGRIDELNAELKTTQAKGNQSFISSQQQKPSTSYEEQKQQEFVQSSSESEIHNETKMADVREIKERMQNSDSSEDEADQRSFQTTEHERRRASCDRTEGCGTATPAAGFDISLKPKDPPTFAGKPNEDVEVWVQQVENFLLLIGGSDPMQVAYIANLLHGPAQLWFQRECKGGNRPENWDCLSHMLLERFGNVTKKEFAQSSLMNIRQGKNETAHDYAMRFEATLNKVAQYDQTWVKNIFIWGLQPNLATTVSLKSPATLSKAMQLAKKVDSSILISRRPGAGNQDKQQAGGKQSGGSSSGGGSTSGGESSKRPWKPWKQWKNQNNQWKTPWWKKQQGSYGGQTGQYSGQPQQRSFVQQQGTQPTSPPSRGRGGGPGMRRFGSSTQRRQVAVIQAEGTTADHQRQESRQQPDRTGTTASRNQRSGN